MVNDMKHNNSNGAFKRAVDATGKTQFKVAMDSYVQPGQFCTYYHGMKPTRPVADRIAFALKKSVHELWPGHFEES